MIKKSLTNLSRYLFLFIFLGFMSSNTFFNHTHIVDGYAIVHSHPYKSDGSGRPLHSHPVNGFLLVHSLNCFLALVLIALFLPWVSVINFSRLIPGCISLFNSAAFLPANSLRGPPQASLHRV